MICQPVGPRCDICLLGIRKLCPSRVSGVKAEGRKPVLFSYKLDGEGDMEDTVKPDPSALTRDVHAEEGRGVCDLGEEGAFTGRGLVRMKSEEAIGSPGAVWTGREVFNQSIGRAVGVKLEES
jgi:hypothetical protein